MTNNTYFTAKDFQTMTLAQVENTLEKYLAIAYDCDWDITPAFEKDLQMLTVIAKDKGSTKKW